MGLMGDIFGGGSKSVSTMTPEQEKLVTRLSSVVGANVQHGVDAYDGQIAAGATGNQTAAFNAAGGLLGNASGHVGTGAASQQALSGQPAWQSNPQGMNDYYDQSIYYPSRTKFNDTLRDLDHRYGARFGQGGAQMEAAGQAASDFESNMAAQRGQMIYGDVQAQRQAAENAAGRQLQAVGAVNAGNAQANQMRLGNLGMLSGLGGQERSINAQGLAEDYGKWEYSQDYNNPWLGMAGTALSAQTKANVPNQGIMGGIMQAGAGLGALAGGIKSFF